MGEADAAVTIAAILQRSTEINSAGGYLRGADNKGTSRQLFDRTDCDELAASKNSEAGGTRFFGIAKDLTQAKPARHRMRPSRALAPRQRSHPPA